jgi:hypothetical protein
MISRLVGIGTILALGIFGETLGFIEQQFHSINFEKGKWTRTEKLPCYVYVARENNALVEIMRFGTGNLVPFRANKEGLTVTVCGSTAAFDEGFEPRAKAPVSPAL